jgi:hypothetical protein
VGSDGIRNIKHTPISSIPPFFHFTPDSLPEVVPVFNPSSSKNGSKHSEGNGTDVRPSLFSLMPTQVASFFLRARPHVEVPWTEEKSGNLALPLEAQLGKKAVQPQTQVQSVGGRPSPMTRVINPQDLTQAFE